jgi:hypothetical protein
MSSHNRFAKFKIQIMKSSDRQANSSLLNFPSLSKIFQDVEQELDSVFKQDLVQKQDLPIIMKNSLGEEGLPQLPKLLQSHLSLDRKIVWMLVQQVMQSLVSLWPIAKRIEEK